MRVHGLVSVAEARRGEQRLVRAIVKALREQGRG